MVKPSKLQQALEKSILKALAFVCLWYKPTTCYAETSSERILFYLS